MSEASHEDNASTGAGPSPAPGESHRALSWWMPSIVAGAIALLLRLLYVLDMRSSIAFDQPIMDELVHDGWARGTIRLFFENVPYFRAPLYPWFLEALYAIDGGYLLPRLVQAVLGAITVALAADVGRRLAGPVAGLAGGLLLAFCWPVIYFTGELLIVTLFSALVVTALWLLVVASERDARGLALAAAAVIGVASIARPTVLVFLPVLVWLALRTWPASGAARLGAWRGRGAVALVIVALLPGLALTVRNKMVGDDWVFIASQGGVNFYIGNNAQSDGRTAVVPGTSGTWLGGYRDAIARAEQAAGRTLRPSEVSRYYYGQGLRYWMQEPGDALGLLARKLRLLVGGAEQSNNKNLHFWRAQSDVLSLPLYTSWAPIFAFGVVGLWLCRRRREATPVWGFLLTYAIVLVAFFLNERFRTPLTVVLSVFAGITVAQLLAMGRERRWREFAVVAGAVVVLLAGSWSDRIGFKGDRIEADAFSVYTMGNMYMNVGEYRQAAASYQNALSIAREYGLRGFDEVEVMARKSLSRALLEMQLLDEADQHIAVLEALAPDDVDVLVLRGRYHLALHEEGEAFPFFRRAVDLAPDHPDALVGLAWCQIAREAWGAAEDNLDRAASLYGPSAEVLAAKGLIVMQAERNPVHARRLFEDALRLDWDTPVAHQQLGWIYHQDNNRARALYHFREALRLDPNNLAVKRFLTRARQSFEHPEGTVRPEL